MICGETQQMPTLDQIFEGLTVELRPFALCEARGDGLLDLGTPKTTTLHYVLAGGGVFGLAGWPDIEAGAGSVLITPALTPQRLQARRQAYCTALKCGPLGPEWQVHQAGIGDNGVIVACAEVEASYQGIEGLFNYLQVPLVTDVQSQPGLQATLEQILEEFAQPKTGTTTLVRALLLQCLVHILRSYGELENSPLAWMSALRNPRLWQATEAIFTHPEAEHSIESLAAIAQMSRSSFAEHFKSAFGHGPIEMVRQVRLRAASKLLLTTDISIKAISRDVGYDSRSYFSRAFHQAYGLSPADYRRAHQTD